jgi:crotonobetainyl-CoA:carnitine CoA-transferase CaiB-like acyl-CoA transferase
VERAAANDARPFGVNFKNTYRGLRVLDLGTNIAAPFAAMMLGDMGADVIKIERPPNGDDTRALPPYWGDEATVFLAVNRNKRSVLLDIRTPEGRSTLLQLVESADVVIESFPPGLADKLKLRFEDLLERNSQLVLCSVSAFGDGPLGAKMPGYDALVQAVSGLMSFTGQPDTPPVRLAPSVLDLSTGMWALIGIQAALVRRSAGGGAEHVRPALLDTAFTLMCHQVLGYRATGDLPQKLGSGAPSASPYRVFEASDGYFMLATASDAQFTRLCTTLGHPALTGDARFATMSGRLTHRDALDTLLGDEFRRRPVSAWLQILSDAGLSVGRVNDIREALALPVVAERDLFVSPEQMHWPGGLPLLRLPIDPDGTGPGRPPPKLGEHTAEVLREAGMDDATLERLNRQ